MVTTMAKKRSGREGTAAPQSSSGPGRTQFPFSLVWAPIPILSWLLPCLGHLGVCTSDGVILDFAGPFTVQRDAFLFGKPTRFLHLEPRSAFAVLTGMPKDEEGGTEPAFGNWAQASLSSIGHGWDAMLDATAEQYQALMYNILTNNCHCFVAQFLNVINYSGHSNWSPIHLAAWMFVRGRYVGWLGLVQTWLPFILLVPVGVYLGHMQFVYSYVALCSVLVAWFLFYYSLLWRPPPAPTRSKR